MRKTYKMLVLTSLFFITFFTLFCSINISNRTVYAEPTINETMSKEEIMEKYYELKEDNQKLRDEYNDLRGEWSTKKDNIDDRVTTTEIYGKAIAFVLAVSGISIFDMKNRMNDKIKLAVEKEVNDKVPQEVAEKVGAEVDPIKNMIDSRKNEDWLKEEKKILTISKNKEEEKELKDSNLLNQFKNVDYIKLGDESNNFNKYDVILFNDINGYFEDEKMKSIIARNRNDRAVYFYFNKRNVKKPDENKMFKYEGNENTNFAKSNSTFCGNLLDLMKYQEDVLKNNKCDS